MILTYLSTCAELMTFHLQNGDAIIKIGKAASSMDTNGKLPGGKGLPKTSLAGTPSSIK